MARHSGEEAKGGSKLNIYTYNARGLHDKIKRARVFEYLKTKMSGIIFLQETHTVPGDQKVWEKEWQGEVMLSSGTSSARGVAILITKEVTCANIVIEADTNGRYILAKGEFDQQDITLLNVYAPTADKACEQQTFLDKLLPVLENNYENLVLGGDLNTYLEDIDKFGTSKTQSKFASRLKNIMSELQLIDIWRITHEDSKRYTWRKKSKLGLQQSRLDYFLIAESLIYRISKCEIQYAVYSDHSPVQLQIENVNNIQRGRGFWKFNVSLLKDTEYVSKINNLLDTEIQKQSKSSNKGFTWDFVKMLIRSETISYASYKAKKKREYETKIRAELDEIQNLIANNPTEDIELKYFTNIKELELINNERTRGHQL